VLLPALALALVVQVVDLAHVPPPVLREAKATVADIVRDLDVDIEWAPPSDAARGAHVIRVTILPYETGALRSHERAIMGSAARTAFGTAVAWVYYQRVLEEADGHLVPPARLLACVIAHEIGHLVLPSPGHTPEGLMRAVWTAPDFRRASTGELRFAPPADR
jgi:hypothetical protein